jgi:hypothetical protein
MGVPGMILAPVVLYYIKVEAKRRAVSQPVASVVDTPLETSLPRQ